MARINVEDSLFRDNRFLKLTIKTGSVPLALGLLIQAWIVAQKFYLTDSQTIPLDHWKAQELSDLLIEVGLAEIVGDGVRMKGAEAQFGWLKHRAEAGRKGGQTKAKNKAESKAKTSQAKSSKPKQTQASSSFSFSYSSSSSNSDSKYLSSKGEGTASTDVDGAPSGGLVKSPIGLFVANYVNAYQLRYGMTARPPLSGKVQGQIKRFLSEVPLERACDMIQVYCQMQDKWFETKCHDFGTFIENQAKIALALDTGKNPSDQKNKDIDWAALEKEFEL